MEDNYSVKDLAATLKKRIFLILGLGVLGFGLAAGFTNYVLTPQYSSTTQVLVNRTNANNELVQVTDINTNVQMIDTYKDIIKGPVILDTVLEELNLSLTAADLSNHVAINNQGSSQVFSLTVTFDNPEAAAAIANQIAQTFQNHIDELMNVENVSIISEAIPNTNQISPNSPLNMAVGLIVGLMAGVGASFLLELTDKTIRDGRYTSEVIGWPNLGSIPELDAAELKDDSGHPEPKIQMYPEKTNSRIS